MQLVTVGTKYQIVIPKEIRNKVRGIKPGAKMNVQVLDDKKMVIKPITSDWVEHSYGIAKKAWKNINPIVELKKMHDEWEDKLAEYEKILSRHK
ncbi:MAG: hypothetical protein UV61_C0015G0002 [Candidatus Gottesmanbacteria bacterium GW2011_GWB1_43_11]|uniref:SpoVT-AbrB domain-containing protein n=1 Tax=Candidatus Gottesmanbacteria bacterium GW2011_GWB1_43_11 TaxID=1618446 RepID=A0A0G1FG04_9BACT|nr:MAG: hypothetical protein UV17_C0053G0003 [Candidatus Gottesmanbacteria bacterium GW2011_GWA1_42_26]KKS80586.1 MAG: hypothetical protein UV55_C0035G0016 [Candidatus Gottesmanbacteria bacterium GW2011_GWC1_43_10]KKS85788.1 MAG: hypothetical protein UV61_C0015G0002 [Candidatus Gottesmanbacteria bacterium GW2011_GWB1_43_11]OGG10000.1 MAG: hypothetical protein A2699_04210 [Candidatus Gottesmanbacteria bacterium RIFCSPHIGHO2_01_FULL_43_15]OGG25259.1 MAG: hypothetical protein A3A59_02815 [Candidat